MKTRNALRRLNLTALLLPDELDRLRDFVAAHQEAPLAPLFPPAPGDGLLDEDDLFAAIHRILRDTLGDQRLRYHHGRHSVGSLLALCLLSESTEYYGSLLPSCTAALARLEESRRIREDLYGRGRSKVQISALDGLSDKIGHGNPKFTLAHYVHSLGFLAAAELANKAEFATDRTTMIAAWYKHTSSIYRWTDESIALHLFTEIFKARLKKMAQQRKQRAKRAERVPRQTRFQMALNALPLAAESRSETEFRKTVGDPTVADLVSTALQECTRKKQNQG